MVKNNKLSRRAFLRSASLTMGSAVLAYATSASQSAAPAPQAKAEVSLWQHLYVPLNAAYEKLIADFKQVEPNITIKFDSVSAAEFEQKLLTALAAGTGPDIFRMPTWSTSTYISKGITKPLNPAAFGKASHKELLDEYAPPSSVDGWVFNGELYAIPIETSVMCTWYRLDIIKKELGVDKDKLPKTWDELWDMAAKLTKKDAQGKINRVGFSWTWNAIWGMHHFSPILYQQGGDILDKDGKDCVLDSAEGLKALNIFADGYRKGGADKDFSVPNAFATGAQLINCSGPFFPSDIKTANPDLKYGEHFVEARLAQTKDGKPTGYMWGPASLTLNPKTKVSEAAYKVMKFIWDKPEVFWQIANIMTTRKKFMESEAYKSSPWLATFMEDAKIARPAVKTVVYEEIKTAIYTMLQKVVYEGIESKTALKSASDEIKKALKR